MIVPIRRLGNQLSFTKQSNLYTCCNPRVTDSCDVTGEMDDIVGEAGGSDTMAPSLIQQPRIVFTGVSGAVMIKMKEVGGHTCFDPVI